MTTLKIDRLLRPKSVAVVGASTRESASGTEAIRNLLKFKFPGPIYPVNPKYQEILGLRCYPALSELPEIVDAIFIGIPAEAAVAVLEEAGRCGIGGAVIHASGFADEGPPGRELQNRLTATAEKYDVALCGPNNVGLINYHDRACLWAAGTQPQYVPGPVALISQSGSIAFTLCEDDRNLGFAYVISSGNEAVCTAADYLMDLVHQNEVRLVMLFLECIRKPELFAEAAFEASLLGKRILALKVGRTRSASEVVAAHTGALAGEDQIYEAFFKRHGVLRADDLDEMIEMANLFLTYPNPPPTRHVVPITMSGGEAALAADLAERLKLSVPELSARTVEQIRQVYPPFTTPRNPLDAFSHNWSAEGFKVMIDSLLTDPQIGVLACCVDAPASGGADSDLAKDMTLVCSQVVRSTDKRIVFINNTSGGGVNPQVEGRLREAGIPFLLGMLPAFGAIAKWTRYRDAQPDIRSEVLDRSDEWHKWASRAYTSSDPERFRQLSAAGVNMVECTAVSSAEEAVEVAENLGYPVVMKGTASNILHKTECGLVRIGLTSADMVAKAFSQLAERLREIPKSEKGGSVVIQPFVESGVELLIGVRNNSDFGSVTVVGLGGTLVEVIREATYRMGPVDQLTALEMLNETRAGTLLSGFRGKGPFDIEAAVEAIVSLSHIGAGTHKILSSIEINPLIVLEQGRGVVGIDVAIELIT